MKSRKNNHKLIEQDRLIQNSTAVNYHTMDKAGGDLKGAKLKQQLISNSNPSLRNIPAGGHAVNSRSGSVTVD